MGSGTTCSSSGSCLRIFNIRLDDICATFEGLYISWNPSLFGSCVTFHGSWQLENVEDLSQASTHHLRLDDQKTNDSAPHAHTNETNKNGRDSTETETWILLTRHLCDTRRTNEYIAINAQDDTVLRDPEHVALKAHRNAQSNYTNSTHLLSRIKTSKLQTQSSGSILACYDGQFEQVGFTVTAYAYSSDVMVSWNTRDMQKVLSFVPLDQK
ncbi:uncharacterized protein F5147DRAFT_659063 [Suillus discolor]|uniref:Uncharacterized protein n=1 Tax=Suillus discolor TaxID=1912936 RepID=A0A9P7ESN2_9AGAM|nr:uncharacterized protein F5147DRAFT_659063 [Suillus discolor]KAG2087030.1 hypothetical protein F5147DRAFT_659063 [Suillus discolor]